MKKIMTVKNLNYKNILKNISFEIEKNSLVAFSGSNNCGKTTLMKLLSGLLNEKETILFENAYLNSYSKTEIYKNIGFVIPSSNVPFIFNNVEQELLFVLDNLGLTKENKKKRYKQIITLFNLKTDKQKDPMQLSTFIKIKVYLALAILPKPKILILDDICSSLTKEEKEEIFSILTSLREKENITIIMTTMDLEETLYADYLYILDEGEIVLEGKPLEVMKQDSKLNKMGLILPFMVDLSLKLKYYELLEEIETDMDRLVGSLWK